MTCTGARLAAFLAIENQLSVPRETLFTLGAAAFGDVKYLLTLNCRHIANAHELPQIYEILDTEGFGQMLICTPAEFLGSEDDEESDT